MLVNNKPSSIAPPEVYKSHGSCFADCAAQNNKSADLFSTRRRTRPFVHILSQLPDRHAILLTHLPLQHNRAEDIPEKGEAALSIEQGSVTLISLHLDANGVHEPIPLSPLCSWIFFFFNSVFTPSHGTCKLRRAWHNFSDAGWKREQSLHLR